MKSQIGCDKTALLCGYVVQSVFESPSQRYGKQVSTKSLSRVYCDSDFGLAVCLLLEWCEECGVSRFEIPSSSRKLQSKMAR